jgi:hypothetical protein
MNTSKFRKVLVSGLEFFVWRVEQARQSSVSGNTVQDFFWEASYNGKTVARGRKYADLATRVKNYANDFQAGCVQRPFKYGLHGLGDN